MSFIGRITAACRPRARIRGPKRHRVLCGAKREFNPEACEISADVPMHVGAFIEETDICDVRVVETSGIDCRGNVAAVEKAGQDFTPPGQLRFGFL